jgi:hypothetical protein
MAIDQLLASCPIAKQTLEYFKVKARIERRIDKFVANVRKHTNKQKLVSELITQLASEGLKIAHIEIGNEQTDELTNELTDVMFVEVSIKLPDTMSVKELIELNSRLVNENRLTDRGIIFLLHVA